MTSPPRLSWPPLRELQRLLRWFGREEVSKDEVASAFLAWRRPLTTMGIVCPVNRSTWGATSEMQRALASMASLWSISGRIAAAWISASLTPCGKTLPTTTSTTWPGAS